MKICPDCAFFNEERFPTCIWCHTVLANVPSTPSADPDHPEHARRALTIKRQCIIRRELGFAAVGYLLTITATAAWPGLILDPYTLLLYSGCGAIVSLAAVREWVGTFSASLLQGFLSGWLVLTYGPMQPCIFFMLSGHIVLPMLFCLWVEMIHDAHR